MNKGLRYLWVLTTVIICSSCQAGEGVPTSDDSSSEVILTSTGHMFPTTVPSPLPTSSPDMLSTLGAIVLPTSTPSLYGLVPIEVDFSLPEGSEVWQMMNVEYVGKTDYSSDGSLLALETSAGVKIYDTASMAFVTEVSSENSRDIEWSPDGRLLAVANANNTVTIWNIDTESSLEPVRDIAYYLFGIRSQYGYLEWSPEGDRLATRIIGDKVLPQIVDAMTGETLVALDTGRRFCSFFSFSPDGTLLAGGCDGGVGIWDSDTGEKLMELGLNIPYEPYKMVVTWSTNVAWSPQGDRVAFSVIKEYVALMVFDATTGEILADYPTSDRAELSDMYWTPDGKHLIMMSGDGVLSIWDMDTYQEIVTIDSHEVFDQLVLSPDGTQVIVIDGYDLIPMEDDPIRSQNLIMRMDLATLLDSSEN